MPENAGYVWTVAVFEQKSPRFRKYTASCGRGLSISQLVESQMRLLKNDYISIWGILYTRMSSQIANYNRIWLYMTGRMFTGGPCEITGGPYCIMSMCTVWYRVWTSTNNSVGSFIQYIFISVRIFYLLS